MAVHMRTTSTTTVIGWRLRNGRVAGVERPDAVPPACDWRRTVPALPGLRVTLREVRTEDAASLLALLSVEEVARFISPPPTSVEGFERFIAWCDSERAKGHGICFAIVPQGKDAAVGIIQVRRRDPSFETAEWGFALGAAYWGTGTFVEAATMVLDFTFEVLGVRRLEARALVVNGRGNGALRKLGACREAILRGAFRLNGTAADQALWSILREGWRWTKAIWSETLQ